MYIASIIIATHNRGYCVSNAIDSAIAVFDNAAVPIEIIVVDDCSSDNTESLVTKKYNSEIQNGHVVYIKLLVNKGVSGARNAGIAQAAGEWVIFLDSDDILVPGTGNAIIRELEIYSDAPVIFFRCIDHDGNKVGTGFSENSQSITLQEFLQDGSKGECLVAVKKSLMIKIPFDEELRGYEGLTMARIIKFALKPAVLSSVIARKYIQTNDDRLSARAGFSRRMHLIAKGHLLMAKEFFCYMPLRMSLRYVLKSIYYKVLFFKQKIFN